MAKSPQVHGGEVTQELGGAVQLTALGVAPRGARPVLDKRCVKRNRPAEFLNRKKPKVRKEKNMTLSLLKAEVWGACNFKCKNTGEPPQKFRGKSRGILLECFEGRKASGETVQREPSQLQAVFPVPGSLLNCKCKQTPARPPGSSSQAGRPFPGDFCSERPPGMEGPSCLHLRSH